MCQCRAHVYIYRPVIGHLLLFLWIGLLSAILTVVADRFFCPALEVIADFFQLPANVAGATLLSFGNGAPDVFTQLAAVSTVRLLGLSVHVWHHYWIRQVLHGACTACNDAHAGTDNAWRHNASSCLKVSAVFSKLLHSYKESR